jgi:septum formation protein
VPFSHRKRFTDADPIVAVNGKIVGKPGTHERAYEMIKKLNNRSHPGQTGVFRDQEGFLRRFARGSSDDPVDKAGATSLVAKIEGEYSNVVGLSGCRAIRRIQEFDETRLEFRAYLMFSNLE